MATTTSPADDRPPLVEDAPPPRRPDSDFLPDPFPAPRLAASFDPVGHQRLVVNPFLAVAGLIGWVWLFARLFNSREPPLALAACFLLAWVPFLVHYHCVDCGATGLWHRWRTHACPRVIGREASGQRGWLAWPHPTTQLVLWGYLLGAASILCFVASVHWF